MTNISISRCTDHGLDLIAAMFDFYHLRRNEMVINNINYSKHAGVGDEMLDYYGIICADNSKANSSFNVNHLYLVNKLWPSPKINIDSHESPFLSIKITYLPLRDDQRKVLKRFIKSLPRFDKINSITFKAADKYNNIIEEIYSRIYSNH